jgi:hypothetical protein
MRMRELNTGTDKRYVRRDEDGKFKESTAQSITPSQVRLIKAIASADPIR